jgi:putative endopeptidase|nr:M13 family metallopeptidase [Kofleriaceae bacterium]
MRWWHPGAFAVVAASALAAAAYRTSTAAPSQGQVAKVSLADVGLEASSLDKTADPCVDFYQFSCGGWLQKTDLPDDKARFARFDELQDKNKLVLRTILDDASRSAATSADAATKKLGDYYASCMDAQAIDAAGTTPIKPLLDKTTKVKDAKSWTAALIALHQLGTRVVFEASAGPDLKKSTQNVTQLDATGLGLPDRDYYSEDKYKDKLAAYHDHVGRMLALVGGFSSSAADDVVAIETEMAKTMKNATERRDVDKRYNPTDAGKLAKTVSIVDWKAYWKAVGIDVTKVIVVGTPAYFAALDKLRAKFKWPQWSAYFTYHLVQGQAFSLGTAYDDEAFAFAKVMTGVEKKEDRWKRCADATTAALGELLGQLYVAKQFPPQAKQTATAVVDGIVAAMGHEIADLDWMSAATKTTAADKLAHIVRMVGYPDKWRTYEFDVKRGDFAGNEQRASTFEAHRVRARSGKPVDRGEWSMNSFTVNAYYRSTANNTALPAGILQPPFFGADRGVAVNFGGIGAVIGHELTHGFDDQGSKFDADGNRVDWWSADDKSKFETKTQCVTDEYATFEAEPKQYVNGKLTLGEDIADLGGVKIAYRAYQTQRANAATTYVADGFTEDQQFFIAFGQIWCSKDRPAEVQRRLATDPHAPPKFRVYGALRNMKEFDDAFHCAEGTPMRPAKVCSVW